MKVWMVTMTDGYETYWTALYATKEVAEEAIRIEKEGDGGHYNYELDEETVHTSATFDVEIVP